MKTMAIKLFFVCVLFQISAYDAIKKCKNSEYLTDKHMCKPCSACKQGFEIGLKCTKDANTRCCKHGKTFSLKTKKCVKCKCASNELCSTASSEDQDVICLEKCKRGFYWDPFHRRCETCSGCLKKFKVVQEECQSVFKRKVCANRLNEKRKSGDSKSDEKTSSEITEVFAKVMICILSLLTLITVGLTVALLVLIYKAKRLVAGGYAKSFQNLIKS